MITNGFSFQPIKLYHDVPNFGLRGNIKGKKFIYMTDTGTLKGIKAKNYDLYLIEANYNEEEILERIKQKEENNVFVNEYRVMNTHLSEQETTNWLLENMGENSQYEFIHRHKDKEKKSENN